MSGLVGSIVVRQPVFVLAVQYPVEGRSPRWFSGEVLPGRHGCTTLDITKAERFENRYFAQHALTYLKPRQLGTWVVHWI